MTEHFRLKIEIEPTINAFLDTLDDVWVPNWNGYGAKPLSMTAMKKARIVANAIEKGGVFVAPLASGGIQIEWENKDGDYVEIEIQPDGTIKGFATQMKELEK